MSQEQTGHLDQSLLLLTTDLRQRRWLELRISDTTEVKHRYTRGCVVLGVGVAERADGLLLVGSQLMQLVLLNRLESADVGKVLCRLQGSALLLKEDLAEHQRQDLLAQVAGTLLCLNLHFLLLNLHFRHSLLQHVL